MPPKPKFTKDEIVTAAFELARAEGAGAYRAREVGRRLGVSSSPIFTVFTDMAELHAAVEGRAEACFRNTWPWRRITHRRIKSAGCSGCALRRMSRCCFACCL